MRSKPPGGDRVVRAYAAGNEPASQRGMILDQRPIEARAAAPGSIIEQDAVAAAAVQRFTPDAHRRPDFAAGRKLAAERTQVAGALGPVQLDSMKVDERWDVGDDLPRGI